MHGLGQKDPMRLGTIHSPSAFFDSVAPAPSPFGSTFACSSLRLPRRAVVSSVAHSAGFGLLLPSKNLRAGVFTVG